MTVTELAKARFKPGDRVNGFCFPIGSAKRVWMVGTIEDGPFWEDCERMGPHVYYGVEFDDGGGARMTDADWSLRPLDAVTRLGDLL